MEKNTTSEMFSKLDHHPGYEISDEFPHTIRNIETKEEVPLIKTTLGYFAKFDEKTKDNMQKIVAKQFLEYNDGDNITFVDEDKLNYNVWNLKVIKNKKSDTIDKPVFVENEYSLNEFRDDLKKKEENDLCLIQIKIATMCFSVTKWFCCKTTKRNRSSL